MPAPFLLPYPFPYSEGASSGVALEVPGVWPAALDGRPYMIDTVNDNWFDDTIPLLRPQQDDGAVFSEQSLNPEPLIRRGADSWHGGAGQTFRDREGGSGTRFRSSKGLNPWEFYELSLLNTTDQKASSANSNLYLAVAGARLYYTDNQTLKYTADITVDTPTLSTVTGTHATAINGIASDGKFVYIAQGAQGIYLTNNAASAAAAWITGTVSGVIAYVKGRLMCTAGAAIYNVTTSTGTAGPTALPAALFTQSNSDWSWVGFAEGKAAIYAAGFSGDKSLVYRIAIKPDASELDQPIIAGELPDGEIIRSIGGYLGFIVLGTDKGVRFCEVDPQGNLNIGRSFGPTATKCFEGQDKFIWFGWSNYDGVSTGLGRMSLETFTEDTITGARQPAYASDLMVTGQGVVVNLATFQNIRVFTIAALGLYAELTTSKVASGTLKTGLIGFGIPDTKIVLVSDVRTQPLDGSYTIDLSVDLGTFTQIGAQTVSDTTTLVSPIADGLGQQFELQFTLTRSSVITLGPVLTRWTLKATSGGTDSPAEFFYVPIILHDEVKLPGGTMRSVDVAAEKEILKGLRRSRRIVTYQLGSEVYTVQAEDMRFKPRNFRIDPQGNVESPDGVMLAKLKRLDPQEST